MSNSIVRKNLYHFFSSKGFAYIYGGTSKLKTICETLLNGYSSKNRYKSIVFLNGIIFVEYSENRAVNNTHIQRLSRFQYCFHSFVAVSAVNKIINIHLKIFKTT